MKDGGGENGKLSSETSGCQDFFFFERQQKNHGKNHIECQKYI